MTVLNIELKPPLPAGQELDEALGILYEALNRHHCTERAIITFCHDWAARLKELFPDLRT